MPLRIRSLHYYSANSEKLASFLSELLDIFPKKVDDLIILQGEGLRFFIHYEPEVQLSEKHDIAEFSFETEFELNSFLQKVRFVDYRSSEGDKFLQGEVVETFEGSKTYQFTDFEGRTYQVTGDFEWQ